MNATGKARVRVNDDVADDGVGNQRHIAGAGGGVGHRLQPIGDKLPPDLKMGIRPFDVGVSVDSGQTYDAAGEVFVDENLCDYSIVAVDVADVRFQAVTPTSFKVNRHQPVFLKFDPQFMRFFDKATGKAIQVPRG